MTQVGLPVERMLRRLSPVPLPVACLGVCRRHLGGVLHLRLVGVVATSRVLSAHRPKLLCIQRLASLLRCTCRRSTRLRRR
jgi:hypothetical protein